MRRVYTAALMGIDGLVVEVEADISGGLPDFKIVGLADTTIKESSERVKAALRNSGLLLRASRITVSLSPADLKKEGAWFDLPIVAAILANRVEEDFLSPYLIAGEVGLDGSVKPVRGALALADIARREGFRGVILPRASAEEAALVKGIEVYPVDHVHDIDAILRGEFPRRLSPSRVSFQPSFSVDFSEVKGQRIAKRAIEVAVAGGHNLLMVGPPGAGKTMLAMRIPSIFPPLQEKEVVEVTKIYSVAGLLRGSYITERPFRNPHHTISTAGLVGGGKNPRPGEVSLAHKGVLFLDEITEFSKASLESLRQPMEDGRVVITRAGYSVSYPAEFMLVAAMNRCEDRFGGVEEYECTPAERRRYYSKLSRPLLDRIDIFMELSRPAADEIFSNQASEPSASIRERVVEARARQWSRFKGSGITCNAHMGRKEIERYCSLPAEGKRFLEEAMEQLGLSARSVDRIIKVARTIADLAGREQIKSEDLFEALNYRRLEKIMWS